MVKKMVKIGITLAASPHSSNSQIQSVQKHHHRDRHEVSLAIIYANVLNILRCVQLKQISQVNAS